MRYFLLLALLVSSGSFLRAENWLEQLRQLDRSKTELVKPFLEDRLLADPHDTAAWVELLPRLQWSAAGETFNLYCTGRAALRAHPDSWEIQREWLRCLQPAAALEELARLEREWPNQRQLPELRSLLEGGQYLRREWGSEEFYQEWIGSLIRAEDWDQAAMILDRALNSHPTSRSLLTFRTYLDIVHERDDQIIASARRANFYQRVHLSGSVPITISDQLVLKGKHGLALAAFGPEPWQKEQLDDADALVLVTALLELREFGKAELVLKTAPEPGAHLLAIGHLVQLKKFDDARELADHLFQLWPAKNERLERERPPPLFSNEWIWPLCAREPLKQAVVWLHATYPQQRALIEKRLALPEKIFPPAEKPEPGKVKPATQAIKEFEARLQKLAAAENAASEENLKQRRRLWAQIRSHWRDLGQYDRVAETQIEEFKLCPDESRRKEAVRYAAEAYLSRVQARALPYYEEHWPEFVHARQTAHHLLLRRFYRQPAAHGLEFLADDEVVRRLQDASPHCLALVIQGSALREPTFIDQVPHAQLLAKHGNRETIPLLIYLLARTVPKKLDLNPMSPAADAEEQAARSAAAIQAALHQLSGVSTPAGTPAEQLEFWYDWWAKNAPPEFAP